MLPQTVLITVVSEGNTASSDQTRVSVQGEASQQGPQSPHSIHPPHNLPQHANGKRYSCVAAHTQATLCEPHEMFTSAGPTSDPTVWKRGGEGKSVRTVQWDTERSRPNGGSMSVASSPVEALLLDTYV